MQNAPGKYMQASDGTSIDNNHGQQQLQHCADRPHALSSPRCKQLVLLGRCLWVCMLLICRWPLVADSLLTAVA